MATMPRAFTRVDALGGRPTSGVNTLVVMGPCQYNTDAKPRRFGNVRALLEKHGYSAVTEYAALHIEETGNPVVVCALPGAAPGASLIRGVDTSGNTGTSSVSVAQHQGLVGVDHEGVVVVLSGGVIGEDEIDISVSVDGGRTAKKVRLGKATEHLLPYHAVKVLFGPGRLNTGDVVARWEGVAARCDADGVQAARQALASSTNAAKSWIVVQGDASAEFAAALASEVSSYASANERFVQARTSARSRRACHMSNRVGRVMSLDATFSADPPTVTLADVADVLSHGILPGTVRLSNTPAGLNDDVFDAASVAGSVITLSPAPSAQSGVPVTIESAFLITTDGDEILRSAGSFVDDGFVDGDTVAVTLPGGETLSRTITNVSSTTLTVSPGDLPVGEYFSSDVSITAEESKTDWITSITSEYAAVDGAPYVSVSAGSARKRLPVSGALLSCDAHWAVSLREYQHDVHVATWKKDEGPLVGWSVDDAEQNLVEYDDRVDGEAASAARFTSLRTWANGPGGVFVSQDLTRAEDGSVLSYTHNVAVTNLARTVVQRATENEIGSSLLLNPDGTATTDSLKVISARVNAALKREVTIDVGEGLRCSSCVWTPATDDDLSGPEARLNGVLTLVLNGTVHSVSTVIEVR